jgi:hypothetical protein
LAKKKKNEIFNIEQVPREDNVEADTLANLGSALKIPLDTKIPIVRITSPTIGVLGPTGKEVSSIETPEPQDPVQDVVSWIQSTKRYLQDDIIPKDEENPRAFRVKVSRFIILHGVL